MFPKDLVIKHIGMLFFLIEALEKNTEPWVIYVIALGIQCVFLAIGFIGIAKYSIHVHGKGVLDGFLAEQGVVNLEYELKPNQPEPRPVARAPSQL